MKYVGESRLTQVLTRVKSELNNIDEEIELREEAISGTTQTVTYNADGNVASITHIKNNATVRTDTFTYGTDTITEVRTLSTGASLTIVTNTDTLTATVTYSAA